MTKWALGNFAVHLCDNFAVHLCDFLFSNRTALLHGSFRTPLIACSHTHCGTSPLSSTFRRRRRAVVALAHCPRPHPYPRPSASRRPHPLTRHETVPSGDPRHDRLVRAVLLLPSGPGRRRLLDPQEAAQLLQQQEGRRPPSFLAGRGAPRSGETSRTCPWP